MRVKCVSGVSLGGGRDIYPGDVVDLEDSQAKHLVALGSVIPYSGAPSPSSETDDEETMREAGGEMQTPPAPETGHREPRVRRKG